MSFNKTIKSDALKILKRNWKKVMGINFIWFFMLSIFFLIEVFLQNVVAQIGGEPRSNFEIEQKLRISLILCIFYIISSGIISILKMGEIKWKYRTINQEENNFSVMFDYFTTFKNILRSWYISLQIFIRKIIWMIIIYMPVTILTAWCVLATENQNYVKDTYLIGFGYILSIFLFIYSTIMIVIFFRRYLLTRYLIVSGECKTVRQAIKESIKMMKNQKINYIILVFSYIWWYVLCIFAISIFFVYPYLSISSTLFERYVVESYKKQSLTNESSKN